MKRERLWPEKRVE